MPHENEAHGDDATPTTADVYRQTLRLTRAVLALRDEMRTQQATPPTWLTSRWRDIVYILILAAMAFGGDLKGALGYAVGHVTGAPVVVSTPTTAPSPAPESP